MGCAVMPVRPAINEGEAPRFFATSYEEVRLSDGLTEYIAYLDDADIRVEVFAVVMPIASTLRPENMCIRKCTMRARPLTS